MVVHLRLDIPPHAGHLHVWGRAADGWWALLVWDEHVGYDTARYTGTETCAGWVAASHLRPASDWADTRGIPRIEPPGRSGRVAAAVSRPGAYLPKDVWWVGVLAGQEPGLPPGVRLL